MRPRPAEVVELSRRPQCAARKTRPAAEPRGTPKMLSRVTAVPDGLHTPIGRRLAGPPPTKKAGVTLHVGRPKAVRAARAGPADHRRRRRGHLSPPPSASRTSNSRSLGKPVVDPAVKRGHKRNRTRWWQRAIARGRSRFCLQRGRVARHMTQDGRTAGGRSRAGDAP